MAKRYVAFSFDSDWDLNDLDMTTSVNDAKSYDYYIELEIPSKKKSNNAVCLGSFSIKE